MINRTDLNFDIARLVAEYHTLALPWDERNQICVNAPPGVDDPLFFGTGTARVNQEWRWDEAAFTEINAPFRNTYLEAVCQRVGLDGRIRLMRVMPKSMPLSIHHDPEYRYHIALVTNPEAYVMEVFKNRVSREQGRAALLHHIPADGYLYEFDATVWHTVFNAHKTDPRVHLVFNRYSTNIV